MVAWSSRRPRAACRRGPCCPAGTISASSRLPRGPCACAPPSSARLSWMSAGAGLGAVARAGLRVVGATVEFIDGSGDLTGWPRRFAAAPGAAVAVASAPCMTIDGVSQRAVIDAEGG